ncbi:DUF255 domain-containing protein [uncultured Cytophaga sp.]|uniref:DUF255 domain-containing protein n=1 Tax=uncultured Cytophaga sp. TaxID=160238 RepID=UPI00261CCE45|nr:DUF255 domain-containing protein [uncultured Cytophaga sp.]
MFKKIFIPIYLIIFIGLVYVLFFRDTTKHPDWEPFNETIFHKAKRENKFVVLQLAANWCHWSHVMEEKTYANPLIIEYLDKNYIVCKEDYDLRQDLTSLYTNYGPPTTIIFDADGNELLKESGFIDNDRFMALLTQLRANPSPLFSNKPSLNIEHTTDSSKQKSLDYLKEKFINSLDYENGGFNFGQKFIDFKTFEYAFNQSSIDTSMHKWVENSIINSTGIYDNVWGGVYQYANNNDWKQVHYEKLLEVQARYIKMYCWYYKRYNDIDALKKAEGIAAYVVRFLEAKDGTYYNAQDADLMPGIKATDYFKLNNEGRIAQGIPAIDENSYTNSNAEITEAFLILWATNNNQVYLDKAIKCAYVLMNDYKINNAYTHSTNKLSTISLKDNLAMVKTLILLYRATSNTLYKKEAAKLLREITHTFNSGNGYLYSFVGSSPLKATYNISENIEACRLLNYSSYFFKNSAYKFAAENIMQFLIKPELIKTYSTEAGILSAANELLEEPNTGVYMQKTTPAQQAAFIKSCISFPKFYFNNEVYTNQTISSEKYELFQAYDKNFMILCTSTVCSSPQYTIQSFTNLLYKRLFNETKKQANF